VLPFFFLHLDEENTGTLDRKRGGRDFRVSLEGLQRAGAQPPYVDRET
jgi:hypothetical protein